MTCLPFFFNKKVVIKQDIIILKNINHSESIFKYEKIENNLNKSHLSTSSLFRRHLKKCLDPKIVLNLCYFNKYLKKEKGIFVKIPR